MKRHDYIKSIYSQTVLSDILLSLAADELSEEDRAELMEQLRKLQEEQSKLEQERTELEEGDLPEDEEEEEPEEAPEEAPEELPEEDEEEVPEDEKVEMPGTLEKGQQLTFVTTNTGMPGILKKYTGGGVLAKVCPVCNYENRPIYLTECERCQRIFQVLKRHIYRKKGRDKKYTPEMAFQEVNFRNVSPGALREIYETKGKTPLAEINEVRQTPRKQLDDLLWYRLNVKKNPKTGEPLLDKRGMPIPLEDRKYFTTEEITEATHLSPESLRAMVSDHNSKVIKNLPKSAQKLVRYDDTTGELLPMSARQLEPYGYIAPVALFRTGMADVRRRVTKEQEEKLSPEQIEGLKGPAFKSIDIAAWNWDKLKTVFGWDEESGAFTHGWMKFLREKFLPAVRRHKLESKISALNRVKALYERIAGSQKEDIEESLKRNKGLRTYTYFYYHPEIDIDEFKDEWKDEYEQYKADHWKIVQKNKVDNSVPGDVRQMLKNYDDRQDALTLEQKEAIIKGLAERLKVSEDEVAEHLEVRDEANEMLFERPREIEYMMFLDANPNATRQSLKKKYERRRKAFKKFVFDKKNDIADQFEAKAGRIQEKIDEFQAELEMEPELPEGFDLNEAVKKYHSEESAPRDPDPEVDEDIRKAEQEVEKENPAPSPEDVASKKKKSYIVDRLSKLADEGQLSLFGPEEEPEEEEPEKPKTVLPGEEAWRHPRTAPKPVTTKFHKKTYWFNNSSEELESGTSIFTWSGKEPIEKELENEVGKYGYHNFGVRPGEIIYVSLTDPQEKEAKVYAFMMNAQGDGPVSFFRSVPVKALEKFIQSFEPEEPEDEELPEPELGQEEKAKEAPAENFGRIKGKYFAYFEWNPDYPDMPNSYKSSFKHTPTEKNVDFEELLKAKIEKRFGGKLLPLINTQDPERENRTAKKYVHITVVEPTTERRRRFGIVFNREDGDFSWQGTEGVVEHKEKERRLNLEKYKDLKAEVNLGVTKLENVKLVGDDDLEVKREEPKEIKPRGPSGITEQERQRFFEKLQKRKKRDKPLKRLTPEELEELEEDEGFRPKPPEFKEPPKDTKPSAESVRKVVIRHGFIRKTMEKPVKDIATGRPKKDPSGKIIMEEKKVRIPKTDSNLVTLRLNKKGEPVSARCERINVGFKETGELVQRRAFPEVFDVVRRIVDKKLPHLRKEQLWDERKKVLEREYERAVEMFRGEDAKPWTQVREKEPYLPAEAVDMNVRPCTKTPNASAPFESACEEIKAAVASMTGKPIPKGFEVHDWGTMKRKEPRQTSKEVHQQRRRHDVTDFFADDKTARLNRIYELYKTCAEHDGKKVKLNDPVRNPPGSKKKFHVFVKDKSGNVRKVQFGDPKMEIKRDDPERRKSFRARHKCDSEAAKDKTKAKYWSCYQWRKSKKVDS
jgi:hypothetical protein